MAKKPTLAAALEGSADAAAAFADGHVDPVAPLGVAAAAIADPLAAAREASRAGLTEDVLDPGSDSAASAAAAAGFILVTCTPPGFRRAGMAHPLRAEYPRDAFTQEQIDALRAEPRITFLVIGGAPIPRAERLFGDRMTAAAPRDPVLAGEAAAAAISDPPNRAAPGLRNTVAGAQVAGFARG